MNEIRINSWNELQDRLFENSWRPDLKRYRSQYAFRGMGFASHRLETSLFRLGGNFAEKERHLLRNFIKYATSPDLEDYSIWHWLALAKHHGLPTRLLDWSFSPFVALHFATANIDAYNQDGVIWMVSFNEVHKTIPQKLRLELESEGSGVFTAGMLSRVADTLGDLGALEPGEFPIFFEPPSIDERIVNQYALFSMMSTPRGILDDWLSHRPGMWRKIILPAELKWEIRDRLDQANITERVLFPGLDGLSSWLKRHYWTRS